MSAISLPLTSHFNDLLALLLNSKDTRRPTKRAKTIEYSQ